MATVTLRPNGAGNTTQCTPNGAANNWDCVNETSSDGDTTYVSTVNSTASDLYTIESNSIGGSDTINSVTVYSEAKRETGRLNSGSLYLKVRENSVTTDGILNTLTTSYAVYSQTWTTRPSDSGAWTKTDIDNLQIGGYLIANIGYTRCTQFYVIVDYTPGASGPANLKTVNGLAKASVKTINGVAIASVKTINGLN